MNPKIQAYLELALLALFMALFLWWIYPERVAERKGETELAASVASTTVPVFPDVELEATAAYVYDAKEGKAIFEKNADLVMPLASLTKVMTALTASRLVPDHVLVRISMDDLREEGDSGLYADEEWRVNDLIDYSLIVSSNDGARALASVAGAFVGTRATSSPVDDFVGEMNRNAVQIGMYSTKFYNPSGLDVSTSTSGGYGSARDMGRLFEYVLKNDPHLLEATSRESLEVASKFMAHVADNTNKAINSIPNVLGSKTGFTDLSGGNLAVAFDAGLDQPVIAIILHSSKEGRFTDMTKLVSATLDFLSQK